MEMFEENMINHAPLAERMRPMNIDDFVGQEHIVGKNTLLYKALMNGNIGSMIFFGPPGTGKTTLANVIANTLKGNFVKLNAIYNGVNDAKEVIKQAKFDLGAYGKKTYLLLDECHRWSKTQSDSILEAIEKGYIVFIGSTTENPYTAMTSALISRCRVYEFKSLKDEDIAEIIARTVLKEEKRLDLKIKIPIQAIKEMARLSDGDVRTSLNSLEYAISISEKRNGEIIIDEKNISQCVQKNNRGGNKTDYYDILSAFCKSLRGSDSDAGVYYMMRLLESGCDPMVVARRLVVHASEDIGMADTNAILVATSALIATQNIGYPECRIPLAHATIYLCETHKSNSVIIAVDKASELVKKYGSLPVPNTLKNHPTTNKDGTSPYKYPHDYGGYVKQNYLPKEILKEKIYIPKNNGREKGLIRKKDS